MEMKMHTIKATALNLYATCSNKGSCMHDAMVFLYLPLLNKVNKVSIGFCAFSLQHADKTAICMIITHHARTYYKIQCTYIIQYVGEDRLDTNPTQNIVHVTFMFHATIIDLHAVHNMHVIMLMYMHVSCNMHEFRTFSCMLHACNMYTT